ncbi:uncharacterized protein LOC119172344 [Rhipicephalus microplus]|uniref:uncharacterized protein LOC119172344 n=1 Tax=Rhipicephalus microplus TaxID=6941 RepID=UPI0023769C41
MTPEGQRCPDATSQGPEHTGYEPSRRLTARKPKGIRWRLAEASGATPILPVLVFTFSVISLAKGLKISPKSCENAIGERGTCMFVWECIKLDGKHLGTCTDGFLYGSCCEYDDSENSVAGGLAPEPPSSSTTTTTTTTKPPSSPPQPQKQRPKPPQHAKPTPGRPGVSASFSTIAVPSYPQRNFTLIYLTPTSPTPTMTRRPSTPTTRRTYRPSTKPSTASSSTRRPVVTTATTAASSSTPTVASVVVTATRWPPTFRPPGITTFWSLFRPRPTLVPIITFRPGLRPPTRPPTTTQETTLKTTTTTTSTTKRPARPPSPQRPQRPQRPQHGTHGTHSRPTTTRKPPATSAAQSGSASTPSGSKKPVPPSQLLNKRPKGECGVPSIVPQTKVVGGKSAAFGAWPWQVSVRRTSFFGFSSTHRCGGAILNKYWIATAGHCVDDLLLSQIRIRVGEYDFSSVLEPYPYAERSAKKKVVHPKYNFFTYENDLALVKVDEPFEFMPHIAPICLPPDNESDDLIGRNATVTGWGRLSEGGVLPSVLQEVKVPIVSNEKCKNMFLAAGRHEYIPNIFMCAGFEEGGRDSCQGDSGGPLQIQAKDGRWFLAGIISWGIGCAEPNLPGVCTRISRFKEWIIKSTT